MPTRAERLRLWLDANPGITVGEAEFTALSNTLSPVSASALRRLLRNSGVPLSPFAAGVNQDSWDALKASLDALSAAYEMADSEGKRRVRNVVITAKDHARMASRNRRVDETKRSEKAAMVDWMLQWLANPPLFPLWSRLAIRPVSGSPGK